MPLWKTEATFPSFCVDTVESHLGLIQSHHGLVITADSHIFNPLLGVEVLFPLTTSELQNTGGGLWIFGSLMLEKH